MPELASDAQQLRLEAIERGGLNVETERRLFFQRGEKLRPILRCVGEVIRVLDVANRATGAPKTMWSFNQGPDIPTPVTDGTLLYIVRDNGAALALDRRQGAQAQLLDSGGDV